MPQARNLRRTGMKLGLAALALFGLSHCANLAGPRDIPVSLDKLQAQLNQRFPSNSRYLEVFDVSLGQPKITFLPEQNRIQFDLAITIAPPFTSKRMHSFVSLSGGLKFDNVRKGVMLADPRVDSLKLDGVDAVMGRQFSKLGNHALERMFKDTPLHRFKDEDLQVAGVQFVPVGITIEQQKMLIHVEPVR